MNVPRLTLAVEHYDRHLPLLEGRVRPEGIDLQVLSVTVLRAGAERHKRMLKHREFDVCELSLSSYLMAKARGLPFTAIPVFPRRLFSQSNMYCNVASGIRSPQDLVGKRVGLNTYQTTLSVLGKGDLHEEYGVPLNRITWVTAREELIPFEPPQGIVIQKIPAGKNIEEMLAAGEVDALMMPRGPRPFLQGSPKVARLFPDPRAEERAYYQKIGYYPIMHTVALKEEVARQYPWVARNLLQAFEEAKAMCYRYYDDPNWSHLAWARQLFEEERQLMGPDPWPNGLARNRSNLERFIRYSYQQGLIDRILGVEELFAETTLDT